MEKRLFAIMTIGARDNGHIRNLAAHHQSGAPDEELVSVKTDFFGRDGDLPVALLAMDRLPRVPDRDAADQRTTLVQ